MIDYRPTHPYGPYAELYRRFFELAPKYGGYEFGQGPKVKNAPPQVLFEQPLRWYSWDRAQRRAAIRRVRDRYVEEILRLKHVPPRHERHCTDTPTVRHGVSSECQNKPQALAA